MSNSDPSVIDRMIDIARGVVPEEPGDREHRTVRRHPCALRAALVQLLPTGGKTIPTIVDCKDISPTGLGVYSRFMLHVGYEGALLMKRSDGCEVILGVKVVYSNYVGDMKHESGLSFSEAPAAIALDDFRDEQGHMPRLAA